MMLSTFIEVETNNNENTVTNLLYGMMKNKYMRDAILRALTESMIRTQASIAGGGLSDLYIDSSSCFILIENKIRQQTPLQESQTTTYPIMVANSTKKVRLLIYLLPDGYHASDESIYEMCLESVGSLPEGMILFPKWSTFTKHLERQELDHDNVLVKEFLQYINNRLGLITDFSFDRKDIITMMNPRMIQNALEFYVKMVQFICDADIRLREMNKRLLPCDWTTLDAKSKDTNQIGKYLNTNNKDYAFWIGYNMETTIHNCNMFLCIDSSYISKSIDIISANNASSTPNTSSSIGYRVDIDPEWVYYPIDSSFLNEENWSDNVQAFCDMVQDRIENCSLLNG
jgi:hypothetical protein